MENSVRIHGEKNSLNTVSQYSVLDVVSAIFSKVAGCYGTKSIHKR
jgi:hypothetical protein